MRGRPTKIPIEARARLEQEVEIIVQRTRYKKLGIELNLTPKQIANYISRELKRREKASNAEG